MGLGISFSADADTVKVAFPVSTDPTELPQAWPEQVGVDSAELVKLSKRIRDSKLDIRSLVVVKEGKIVFERYSSGLTRDNNYELYSITKAVTSILAGDLIEEGKISLRDAQCLQILRYMMSEYILPALDKMYSEPTDGQKQALLTELQLAEDSKGVSGFAADPTDTPQ